MNLQFCRQFDLLICILIKEYNEQRNKTIEQLIREKVLNQKKRVMCNQQLENDLLKQLTILKEREIETIAKHVIYEAIIKQYLEQLKVKGAEMKVKVKMKDGEGHTFYVEDIDDELKLKWCSEDYSHEGVISDKSFVDHLKFAIDKGLTVTISPVVEE